MKKLAGKLLLLLTFGLLILLIGGTINRKAQAEEAAGKIRILPHLVMTDIWGNNFSTDQITSGPLLITFFHPECEHCRFEISSLISSDLLDNNFTVMLVSNADKDEIQSFIKQFGIVNASNLYILHDSDFKVSDFFRVDIMPSSFIYNDNLQLVKIFKGSTRPEAMLKFLHSND